MSSDSEGWALSDDAHGEGSGQAEAPPVPNPAPAEDPAPAPRRRGRPRGPTRCSTSTQTDEPREIQFSTEGMPFGPNAGKFTSYVAKIARTMVPPHYKDWRVAKEQLPGGPDMLWQAVKV